MYEPQTRARIKYFQIHPDFLKPKGQDKAKNAMVQCTS